MKMAEYSDKKKLFNDIKNVSISQQTVYRRVEKISSCISNKVVLFISLLIFLWPWMNPLILRGVNQNFTINKTLAIESLHCTTKDQDISDMAMIVLNSLERTNKYLIMLFLGTAIVTDGTKVMIGSHISHRLTYKGWNQLSSITSNYLPWISMWKLN